MSDQIQMKIIGYQNRSQDPQKKYRYGFYEGGDPRNWFPDAALNTNEQIEHWESACAEFDAAEAGGWNPPELPSQHVTEPTFEDYHYSSFGGGMVEENPEPADAQNFWQRYPDNARRRPATESEDNQPDNLAEARRQRRLQRPPIELWTPKN